MAENQEVVDVVIVGGGPVGLVTAYQLLRFNPHTSIHIVEKNPKPAQEAFGRAVTFWSRSMEMLDQIGLAQEIIQQCCSVRTSAAFDYNGNEVFGRGWSFLEGITDTRWSFASVLRQKYVEEIFRGKLQENGTSVKAPAGFESLEVDESVPIGGYRVTATIWDDLANREYTIKCKYLIGCDGSRTTVRAAAGIDSDGDRTEDKWVRIDGLLKHTNMPKPRSYGSLESPTYGNVLWIPLDHGTTRIGFALTEERRKLYSELTQEVFVKEAKLSVAPFTIEYERVDWASVYVVGQRVARKFFTKDCIFLAGDACHTHSSGAGQGMNAGMHDAVNLAWKLSLVLRGAAKPALLETYEAERRPNAQKLIKYDEDISMLVSGRLPKSWTGDPRADPPVVLGKILQEAKGFNTGLTIGYQPNPLNLEEDEEEKVPNSKMSLSNITIPAPAQPGYRAPDVKILLPALFEQTWLHRVTPNYGYFNVVVFTGDADRTRPSFFAFREAIIERSVLGRSAAASPAINSSAHHNLYANARPCESDFSLLKINGEEEVQASVNGATCSASNGCVATTSPSAAIPSSTSSSPALPITFLTLLSGTAANAWHSLGTQPLGCVYYDPDQSAHARYDVDISKGAVFILRPDGWIGARFELVPAPAVSSDTGEKDLYGDFLVRKLEGYFGSFLNGLS